MSPPPPPVVVHEPHQKNVVAHFKLRDETERVFARRRFAVIDAGDAAAAAAKKEKNDSKTAAGKWRRSGRSRKVGLHPSRLNFRVLPAPPFSFTFFPSSGDVIATGIRTEEGVGRALETFARILYDGDGDGEDDDGGCGWRATVVNSTYVGRITGLTSACRAVNEFRRNGGDGRCGLSISFRSQFFPGVRIRCAGLGTINLFNNGKYVIVGVKRRGQMQKLVEKLCAITKTS